MNRRNLKGYWDGFPDVCWPENARLAISFVINVEEGAELSIADGDERNEFIYEAKEEVVGVPDPCMESHFGFGPRVGYRRIVNLLETYGVTATFSCCGKSAERLPWLLRDAADKGHELACHGWRWERLADKSIEEQRKIISSTHAAVSRNAGINAVGWHTRSASSLETRKLLIEHGGFLYDSDAYDDDTPYVEKLGDVDHVILPYAFDTNDMRFQPGGGFIHAKDFAEYCGAGFDCLWREGEYIPRMMSIGLHLRIIGKAARISGLEILLEQMTNKGEIWFASRAQIAEHWRAALGLSKWQSTHLLPPNPYS